MGEVHVKPLIELDQVAAFLAERHQAPVTDVQALKGGFWSSAYAYTAGDEKLVLRIGSERSWFETDRAAHRFTSDDLPIPRVLDIGEAFERCYAISERRHGGFLELAPPERSEEVGSAVLRIFTGLRAHAEPDASVHWVDGGAGTWHDWLRHGLQDSPGHHTHGWRARLTDLPDAEAAFSAAYERFEGLLSRIPERRDLVHSDLLHGNVLMTPDWSRATAIFSWKCSARGDFLYDVAWCTTWASWFPGIQAAGLYQRVLDSGLFDAELEHADARHLCYQLQIAASHMGWYLWTEDTENLRRVTDVLAEVLESA